jgi:hypothetical protein
VLAAFESIKNEDPDAIFFVPTDTADGSLHVETKNLNDQGEKLDGSPMGDCYHVILFKVDEEGDPKFLDRFEAILVKPLEYISMLIPDDWYGIVCRKTTTSGEFVQKMFDELKSM